MTMATQGIFMYNDKLYQQVDGVVMGSPLGPTIANFLLAHLETVLSKNKLLANNNSQFLKMNKIIPNF